MEQTRDERLAKLPEKPFLSRDDVDEIWNARGMKHYVDKLHVSMLSRGLVTSVDREAFRSLIRHMVDHFLVDGKSTPDPKIAPKPRFPQVY
jgi:hypothetical protein